MPPATAQTCGDIITHRAELHLLQYGVRELLRAATGTTSNVREAGRREDRKSIGVERTFSDKHRREDLLATIDDIATSLAGDMEELGFSARCLTLKFKTHDYHCACPARHRQHVGAAHQLTRRRLPLLVASVHARPDHPQRRLQVEGGACDVSSWAGPSVADGLRPVHHRRAS